ncbi:MAG: zinc dependent phospholipase C family protein [Anaerostipes sp.]|nr:zinc dependent phospholipase C family protein [Anaerostipes sp.]
MPSNYAHYSFGKQVYQKQPAFIKKIIHDHLDLYLIGLHGPDIFFYYHPLSTHPINQMGNNMHDQSGLSFFGPACDLIRQQKQTAKQHAMLAYILGFLCHFSLDTCCHSYIEKKILSSHISHTEIEAEFDRYLMVQEGYPPLKHHLTTHIRPTRKNTATIASFFPMVSQQQVSHSLITMIFCDHLLLAPHEWKRKLLYSGMKFFGKYESLHGMIINRSPNPHCKDSCMRLEKLMDSAIPLCLKLTENLMEHLNHYVPLDQEFLQTFGPGPDWESIPILSPKEEKTYEI